MSSHPPSPALRRTARVLIVDDEPVCVVGIARLLQRRGLCVVCLESGHSALGAIETEHFDLVISDVQMPGINGLQLIGLIRSMTPRIPAILISGQSDPGIGQRALDAGADLFIPKDAGAAAVCCEAERILAALQ